MISNIKNIGKNTYLVEIDFSDEGIPATAKAEIIGTEEQATAYAVTLANDYKTNHADLFPVAISDNMEAIHDIR